MTNKTLFVIFLLILALIALAKAMHVFYIFCKAIALLVGVPVFEVNLMVASFGMFIVAWILILFIVKSRD